MKKFDEYAEIVKCDLLDGGRCIGTALLLINAAIAVGVSLIGKDITKNKKAVTISTVACVGAFAAVKVIANALIKAETEDDEYCTSISDLCVKKENDDKETSDNNT